MNIGATMKFNASFNSKKEELKLKPVKLSHVCLAGAACSFLAMGLADTQYLSGVLLSGLGGYVAGCAIPYIVRNVRIADLDYQIYMNNAIIADLEREKEKIMRK